MARLGFANKWASVASNKLLGIGENAVGPDLLGSRLSAAIGKTIGGAMWGAGIGGAYGSVSDTGTMRGAMWGAGLGAAGTGFFAGNALKGTGVKSALLGRLKNEGIEASTSISGVRIGAVLGGKKV